MGGRGEFEDERIEAVAKGLRHALGKAGVMTPVDAEGADPIVATDKVALTTSTPGSTGPRSGSEGLAPWSGPAR